jgi:hypothetical protein
MRFLASEADSGGFQWLDQPHKDCAVQIDAPGASKTFWVIGC